MTTRTIVPPDAIVTAAEARAHLGAPSSVTDATLDMMIAAVQQTIDGPPGWVRRSFGVQTLEVRLEDFSCMRLECPPIIAIVSISYLDTAGALQTIDEATYYLDIDTVRLVTGSTWPTAICAPNAVRVRYTAGYNGEAVDGGGTGPIPANARYAVLLMTQILNSVGATDLLVRREEVDGVGEIEYGVPASVADVLRTTSDRLLGPLEVYWP